MGGADRVRRLIRAYQHREAEALLTLLLKERPEDAELWAELALLYCFTQREFEAVDLLPKVTGASRSLEVEQILADYLYCRQLMAAKLGVDDPKGTAAARAVQLQPRPGVGITLAACLIVKNEEAVLPRCLDSVREICDEIVVVDTGSTDRTVEIASSYGAKIGHFEWCDDFSAARNASLDLATSHWVLWIDADEELTPESWNAIREGLIRNHFGGYYVRIVNLMDDENEANQYVHTPVRLFRRIPEIRFEGRIHEQVLQDFDRHGFIAATLSNATLRHYGYQPSIMAEKDKLNRTVTMLERETREHPRDAFHWFNLANAYSVGRRHKDAEVAARMCINFLPSEAPYAPVAYQILTSALLAQDRADEALQECHVAELKGHLAVINEFDRAHALLKLDRPEDALASIDRCLTMEWPSDLTGDYAIKTYKGAVLKAQALVRLGRADEALTLVEGALEMDPGFGIAHYAKALALEALGRVPEAAFSYLEAAKQPGMEGCRLLGAKAFAKAGDPAKASIVFEVLMAETPRDPEVAAGLIQSLEQIGDLDRLLAAYGNLVSAGHLTAPLLTNWGRALVQAGQLTDAMEAYRAALEVDANYANAHLNAGDLLYALGQYADAAARYEAGLRLDPLNPQAWFVLGNCFARLGHEEGATLAYRQALAIDPNHSHAQTNLQLIAA